MFGAARDFIVRDGQINWAVTDQALVSGANFATGVLLARSLGLEEFGRFTLLWMGLQLLNQIPFALVSAPMMSVGPKQKESRRPAYYGAVLALQIAIAVPMFMVVWLGLSGSAWVFPDWRLGTLALVAACAVLASQIQDFVRRYLFTRGRAAAAFVNDSLRYLGQLAALIGMAAFSMLDTGAALLVITVSATVAALAGVAGMDRMVWSRCSLSAVAARHWRLGKWLLASVPMRWSSSNLYILIAGTVLGAPTVGGLRAAQDLMGVTHIFFLGLENAVPGRAASHYHHKGRLALATYLRKLAFGIVLSTVAVAVPAAVAPHFWLDLIYGDQFRAYGPVLRWFAFVYVILSLALPLKIGLRTLETTKPIFRSTLVSLLFSVLSSYSFVITFGALGVPYGILIMNICVLVVLWSGLRTAFLTPESRPA